MGFVARLTESIFPGTPFSLPAFYLLGEVGTNTVAGIGESDVF